MTNFFTSYKSVEPPKFITPTVQNDYIQAINLLNSLDIPEDDEDLTFDDSITEEEVEKPSFINNTSFNNASLFTNNPLAVSYSVQQVIDKARSFIGSKYSWGGSNPNTGFDCSGLMKYVFKSVGIDLPRVAAQQGKVGKEVDIKSAQPGDMIWFGSKNSPSGQHIGLISKIENGQIYIIDAAGKKLGVTERKLPNLQIKSVRRIMDNSTNFGNTVLAFFKNKGLSEAQARGILGNLMQESRGDHSIVNKHSGAYGLAQWLGPRKQTLMAKYGSNPTLEQQLEFIWEELNTTEKRAKQKLLETTNVADATRSFAQYYERPGKNEMNIEKRIQYAYNA